MTSQARRLGLAALWTVILLFTAEIAVVSLLRYLTARSPAPDFVLANGFANPFLIIHVLSGVAALVTGIIQLAAPIRRRWPKAHRWTGRAYVAACFVAAPAGFMLAIGTQTGSVAAAGFAIPAMLWPVFTVLGLRSALERRFDRHRVWMIRSYAITGNAITLRLLLPLAGLAGIPFMPAYRAIAWLGWIVNLVLAEAWLRRRPRAAQPGGRLAPA